MGRIHGDTAYGAAGGTVFHSVVCEMGCLAGNMLTNTVGTTAGTVVIITAGSILVTVLLRSPADNLGYGKALIMCEGVCEEIN